MSRNERERKVARLSDEIDRWVSRNASFDDFMAYMRVRINLRGASDADWIVAGSLLERVPARLMGEFRRAADVPFVAPGVE